MKQNLIGAFALALSIAAQPAAATTIEIEAQFGQDTQRIDIDCDRLGNLNRPNLSTLTQLDSMIHGYEGDVYQSRSARNDALESLLENFDEARHGLVRSAFERQFQEFDRASTDGQRLSAVARKIALHDVNIGQVLEACR